MLGFLPPAPMLKRPRVGCSFLLQRPAFSSLHRREDSDVFRNLRSCLPLPRSAEASKNELPNELPNASRNVLPAGAFTILLKVTFRTELSVLERKTILSEYGRKTCAEPGVIRCDVLYEVNSRNLAKNSFYELWITFADSSAYMEHERTTHASKLRLCLENPAGGDNSVMLTKLSHSVSVLRPVRPEVPKWRSAYDYSNEGNQRRTLPLLGSKPDPAASIDPESSAAVRKSLDMLISSVGLENVKILISIAEGRTSESFRKLREICEAYLADQEKSAGIIRTGLLIDKSNPRKIILMTVHDASDDDGACFDMELGVDHISDGEWDFRRCFAVFPDRTGWEERFEKDDINSMMRDGVTVLNSNKLGSNLKGILAPEEESVAGSKEIVTSRPQHPTQTTPEPESPKLRLLQGPGAFDSIKRYLRDMIGKRKGDMKAMVIYGWNTSRIHDLVVQLEYDRRKDPGVISYTVEFNVRSMDVTTENLRKAVGVVRNFQPDVIIGYGGGSVMDMAKAVASLGLATDEQLTEYVASIDDAAESGKSTASINKSRDSIPLMLIPTTIGSGAELVEWCVFTGRKKTGEDRRVCVYLWNDNGIVQAANHKTILSDSRLVGPRRLDGFHASQGALQLLCFGVDVILSSRLDRREQQISLAVEGIELAFKEIMPALREPYNATGQSRDPLVTAKTTIGLARDGVGRMGLCLRLSLAVIDSMIDGRYPVMFRMVLTRVTISVLNELCRRKEDGAARQALSIIRKAMNLEKPDDIVQQMLARAEDCDVLLLKQLGIVRRLIPTIAANVVTSVREETCSALEELFADQDCVERVLHHAIDQDYEL